MRESNPRPDDYKSPALPSELMRHIMTPQAGVYPTCGACQTGIAPEHKERLGGYAISDRFLLATRYILKGDGQVFLLSAFARPQHTTGVEPAPLGGNLGKPLCAYREWRERNLPPDDYTVVNSSALL